MTVRRGSNGRTLGAMLLALSACACATPTLSHEGQLVFSEGGRHGATVLTANGVEFMDRTELPRPVVRTSAFEPWRPPTGFLLPADGVLRERSQPVTIAGHGLGVVLRASDRVVPSWGGEILLRLDALVPSRAFPAARASLRAPLDLAIVVDDDTGGATALVDTALDNLGERDRVTLVDSSGRAHTVVPPVPGSHRSLLEGATERIVAARRTSPRRPRDLPHALAIARAWLVTGARVRPRRQALVLVVGDGLGVAVRRNAVVSELSALARSHVRAVAVASTARVTPESFAPFGRDGHAEPDADAREDAVAGAVPPPGDTVLSDVVLEVDAAPAPARIIEASGGEVVSGLESDRLEVGELYAGEARTEVVRLTVPAWVPGEPWEVRVAAHYRDATSGRSFTSRARLAFVYSDDLERVANQRAGDVLAYASALAMVRRLERTFVGKPVDELGGLRGLVAWQASSLAVMARRSGDASLARESNVLATLLAALDN